MQQRTLETIGITLAAMAFTGTCFWMFKKGWKDGVVFSRYGGAFRATNRTYARVVSLIYGIMGLGGLTSVLWLILLLLGGGTL